jgi:hypothetical protein
LAEDLSDTIIGSIIGGAISGLIGVFLVHYTHSKLRKKEMIDDGYIPLLDEVSKMTDWSYFAKLPTVDIWKGLDTSLKARMNRHIRKLLEDYSVEAVKCRNLLDEVQLLLRSESYKMDHYVINTFRQADKLNENGAIMMQRGTTMRTEQWAREFLLILLDPVINTSEKLYLSLQLYGQGDHKRWLNNFKEDYPSFYDVLLEQLLLARDEFHRNAKIHCLFEQKHKVDELSRLLIAELEKIVQ